MVTTFLVRGQQAHQSVSSSTSTPTTPLIGTPCKISPISLPAPRRPAAPVWPWKLYRNLFQQAVLCSYIDDFKLLGFLSLLCLPFLLLFRTGT